ncbi:MAG: hypothetical protein K1X64_17200 [Myxococcaceae bacterium]|nr:hypothetical protein [Myxococcaceae bacterium]
MTGPISGHSVAGWGWAEYLGALVEEFGTLAAVAWKLFEQGGGDDDVGSIERALRRLRTKRQHDGGIWGDKLLACFGMPRSIEDRLVWMGVYHSLFNDLPVAICTDQLRLWDFPPVSASPARVWLLLCAASLALRRRDFAGARVYYDRVAAAMAVGRVRDEARIEHALMVAYLESRTGPDAAQLAALESAERLLAAATLSVGDRACFTARLVDSWAFRDNHRSREAEAMARYRSLPVEDVHPFASYRREAGLAYGHLWADDRATAHRHARAACDHAGDGGYARLRVMGLILCARTDEPGAARVFLARARAMAARLGEEELAGRVERAAVQLGLG